MSETALASGDATAAPADLRDGDTTLPDEAAWQFVTFHLGEECFAVPLRDVQEIIRLPAVVDVPLATSDLEGLANLRGTVLPIINLRRMFKLDSIAHDDATRVVVINTGHPVGFVVDRMARVVTAEAREVEGIDGLRASIDTDLLQGIIKRGQSMIMILDTPKLKLDGIGQGRGRAPVQGQGSAGAEPGRREASVSDEVQLVSFELDGQEYALPIENVQEIVQVPETIVAFPNAQSHALGVMNLRNRLLPLVSLRSMFGMPAKAVSEQSRIVVVTHAVDGVEQAVGLVTDTVKEVLRVQRTLIDPLPSMLTSQMGLQDVDQICRMDGGKRLVSILLPGQFFGNAQIRAALAESADPQHGKESGMTRTGPDSVDDEEQFVIFRVADEEYGVPIDAVQEIVRIPEQITRVPKAPSFIEGVVNLRGAVLPVVDQRQRFGLARMEHNDRQRIMVFVVHGVRTGFIVDSVSEVLRIARAEISPAPEVATDASSAVSRVANIVQLKRMILMLDVARLLDPGESTALRAAA